MRFGVQKPSHVSRTRLLRPRDAEATASYGRRGTLELLPDKPRRERPFRLALGVASEDFAVAIVHPVDLDRRANFPTVRPGAGGNLTAMRGTSLSRE